MPELPPPSTPPNQVELRRQLEDMLGGWNITYAHQDRFWESDNGREAIYGWGTRVEHGQGPASLHVWYDGLDEDIAIWGGQPSEWHEWRDLTDLPAVLAEVRTTLHEMLR